MKITILTLFPEVINAFVGHSILKRAQEKEAVVFNVVNLRDFAPDKHHTVDDRPYGGGAGMLLKVDVLVEAIESIEENQGKAHKILLTPSGELLTQAKAIQFAEGTHKHIMLICGHYEGFDARILHFVDEQISIGSYVLSGGEAAAMVITDAVVRLLSGVLKKEDATTQETFWKVDKKLVYEATGDKDALAGSEIIELMEYPQYTRPEDFRGYRVPTILQKGNHAEIKKWQLQQAWENTKKQRI